MRAAGSRTNFVLLSATSALALGLLLAPTPVQAQFVCGGSPTGAEAQTGDGATATGVNAVACGGRDGDKHNIHRVFCRHGADADQFRQHRGRRRDRTGCERY